MTRPADILFPEKLKLKQEGKCTVCHEPIKPDEFRDELSRKEYKISGMCQLCQDDMWKE